MKARKTKPPVHLELLLFVYMCLSLYFSLGNSRLFKYNFGLLISLSHSVHSAHRYSRKMGHYLLLQFLRTLPQPSVR